MRILIAGAGKVGRHLAGALAGSGHTVTLVDRDPRACADAAAAGPTAACGDVCLPDVLEDAGVRGCDVVAAVTGVDETNLVVAFLARREFDVPRVIARVNDPANAWLFTPLRGVDVAVSQAHLMSTIIEEELSLGAMVTLAALHGGKVAIVEERVPAGSGLIGRRPAEVSLPRHTAVVAVLRGGELVPMSAEFSFQEADELVAVVTAGAEAALAALIGGP